MDRTNSRTAPLKTQAKALRQYLAEQGVELGHSKCLEAVARTHGFKNWDTASGVHNAEIGSPSGTEPPYAVILLCDVWNGGRGYDVADMFKTSFLHEDGRGAHGYPAAVDVHVALAEGREIPPDLGSRVLAICSSEDEYESLREFLEDVFGALRPTRQAALWRVLGEKQYPAPEKLTVLHASEIPDAEGLHGDVRALVNTVKTILEEPRGGSHRALWRLLDATLLLADELGETEVTSGFAEVRGWTMRKRKNHEPVSLHDFDAIVKGIQKYYDEHGKKPTRRTGDASASVGYETSWAAVDRWLKQRGRGSLSKVAEQIREYFKKHGEAPTKGLAEWVL